MEHDEITRRKLLQGSAVFAGLAALPFSLAATRITSRRAEMMVDGTDSSGYKDVQNPLKPPKSGIISVAYPLSEGAIDIDFTGPWGVFGSVMLPGNDMVMPFHQYSVAQTKAPLVTASGLTVVPDFTFESAPQPQVIVIAAQQAAPDAMLRWIRERSTGTDVTMSVCVGSFVLARTGLLDGKSATTHHDTYTEFAKEFPKVHVVHGVRFVNQDNVATSGGLAAGIDLAMNVIERYYGRQLAEAAAYNLEYQGQGWKHPSASGG